MTIVTKAVLKTYFEQGDIPTQGQYVDLIESQFGLGEEGITQIIQGTISASSAEIEDMTFKKLHLAGNGVASMKVGTTFRVGQTLEISGSLNITNGNIIITSSGEFQGNLTGSYISASGHIYSAGNITASGNISSSGNITADAVYTDLVQSTGTSANLYTDASFEDLTIGYHGNLNSTLKINSNITSSGNISASDSIITAKQLHASHVTSSTSEFNTVFVRSFVTASSGVFIPPKSVATLSWGSGLTSILTAEMGRNFQLKILGLPSVSNTSGIEFSGEFMRLDNLETSAGSIILIQQSTVFSSGAKYISLIPYQVVDGHFYIKPFNFRGVSSTAAGGDALFNFIIL